MNHSLPTADRLRSDADFAAEITCILSDVDGVLSDGKIIYGQQNQELKTFHVRDGLGIKLWMRSGFHFGIITARNSEALTRRAQELGIEHVVQNANDKWKSAQSMMAAWDVKPQQVCYIGDDLPDIQVMRRVGLAVCPADASSDVLECAHWTMKNKGGEGAVRELVERLLRAAGHWQQHLSPREKS